MLIFSTTVARYVQDKGSKIKQSVLNNCNDYTIEHLTGILLKLIFVQLVVVDCRS